MIPSVPANDKSYWTRRFGPFCDLRVLDSVAEFHASTTIAFPEALPVSFAQHVPPEMLVELAGSESCIYPEGAASPTIPPMPLRHSATRKQSAMRFAEDPLSQDAVYSIIDASLLAWTQDDDVLGIRHRPYPSAGGLFPVETFVALTKPLADDGQPARGIYHVLPVSRRLVALQVPERGWTELLIDPGNYGYPPLVFVYAVDIRKAIFKYGARGYRHALLEAGSMYQQVDLCARTLGLGTRLWSGFQDYRLAQLLALAPSELVPVVVHWVGREEKV